MPRHTFGSTLSDAPKGDSRNTSLMDVVGGASVSAKACRCLHEQKGQRWSMRAKDKTNVEELSNMESAPKWEAPPRERARFIFALVCTMGISSVCWAF